MRGAAGADRGNGVLPAHAHAGGVARSAGLGGGADAIVGGRDDRGRVDHPAGRLALWWAWRGLAVGAAGGGQRASLAANVAVAEPTATGRVIAAWPSFALIAAYELLMRQVRRRATVSGTAPQGKPGTQISRPQGRDATVQRPRPSSSEAGPAGEGPGGRGGASRDLRRQAWQWALANRAGDGSLPSGREIARQYGRHERWGRLVKRSGAAGELATAARPANQTCGSSNSGLHRPLRAVAAPDTLIWTHDHQPHSHAISAAEVDTRLSLSASVIRGGDDLRIPCLPTSGETLAPLIISGPGRGRRSPLR